MFPRISSSSFLIGYRSVCSPKSSTQSNYHNCSCVRQRSLAPVRIDDMRMPSNPFAQSRNHFAEVETGLYGRSLQSNARHMINIFELYSFRQLVEKPTRVTLDSATIIDHVATPNDENIIKTGGHETSISDQYMVFCIRKFNGVFNTDHKMVRTSSM